jgi:hypothetical protein
MDEEGLKAELAPLYRWARMALCLVAGIYLLVPPLWFEAAPWVARTGRATLPEWLAVLVGMVVLAPRVLAG